MDSHPQAPTRIVIVGTGTGVGKTHVSCALIRAARLRGLDAVGLKPIETGVRSAEAEATEPSDQEQLANAGLLFHVKHSERHTDLERALGSFAVVASDPFRSAASTFHVKRSLYAFVEPISPHLAAARAGVRLDLAAIREWVLRSSRDFTVIETAGGLFSPLGSSTTNLDLVAALLPARVLLVAPDRLGVLHDVTATMGLAAARRLVPDAVVLSAPATPDASTGQNVPSLTSLGIASPLATFPRASDDDPESLACANRVLDWLMRVR